MPLEFAWKPLDTFLDAGVGDLLAMHWEEVANDKDLIPLAPDWDRYRVMERAGDFKALGAWRDGKLIGYNAFFVFSPYHYRHSSHAMNDIVYIDPDERGEAGIRMILTAERDLFAQGVVKIMYHSKVHVLLAAGARGAKAKDSLDNLEMIFEIEQEFGIEVPDDVTASDLTLGGLLGRLGYGHVEDCYAKVKR